MTGKNRLGRGLDTVLAAVSTDDRVWHFCSSTHHSAPTLIRKLLPAAFQTRALQSCGSQYFHIIYGGLNRTDYCIWTNDSVRRVPQ